MWAVYFESALKFNAEDVTEANINIVSDRRTSVLGELNEIAISI